jgi:hypothetical protein
VGQLVSLRWEQESWRNTLIFGEKSNESPCSLSGTCLPSLLDQLSKNSCCITIVYVQRLKIPDDTIQVDAIVSRARQGL